MEIDFSKGPKMMPPMTPEEEKIMEEFFEDEDLNEDHSEYQ